MRISRLTIAAVALIGLSAPVLARDEPVVVFMRGSAEDATSSIASMCVARSIPVMDQGPRHVVCGAEVSGFSGVLTQVLIGNSYSTTPKSIVRFTVVPGREYVTIQATQWVETQMAFGQIRQVPVSNKKNNQRLKEALISAGAYTSPPPPIVVPPTEPAPAKPAESVVAPAVVAPAVPAPAPAPKARRPAVICVTCRN